MSNLIVFKRRADAAISSRRDEALKSIVATLKKVRRLAKPSTGAIANLPKGHFIETANYHGFEIFFDSNPGGIYFSIERRGCKLMTGYLSPQPPTRARLSGTISPMTWKRSGWESDFCG